MRLKSLLIILSIIGNPFIITVFGQKLDTVFTRYYSAENVSNFKGIEIANASNNKYLISASLVEYADNTPPAYKQSAWVMSVGRNGDTNWTFRLRDTTPLYSQASGLSAIESSDSNLIFLSKEDSFMYLTKLTQNGEKIWKSKLDTIVSAYTDRIFETPDKGFFFGESHSNKYGSLWWSNFIKTDNVGKVKTVHAINGMGNFRYTCMNTCNDNGYILGCKNNKFSEDSVMILKVDNLGNTEWSSYISKNQYIGSSIPTAILQLKNGYIAVAITWSYTATRSTLSIINPANNVVFQREFVFRSINDLIQENDSTIIYVGQEGSGMACFGRIRINANLDTLDYFEFNYNYDASANSIIKAHDNGYVITGYGSLSAYVNRCLFAQIRDNPPPKFADNHPDREVKEDYIYCDTIHATDDFPNDRLRYYLLGTVPSGMRIDSITGILLWKPLTELDSGNHIITIRVKDRVNQADTTSWNLHVTPVNDRHVIAAIGPLTVKEGDTATFKVSVRDEENGLLNYLFKIDGHTFTNDSIIKYYFNYSSASRYDLYCKVFDTINSADTTVVITVNNTALPPQILQPDSMQTSLSTVLNLGWLSGIKDPDLDSSSIRFRVLIYQLGNSSIRTLVDSLKSDSLCLAEIDSINKFSSGMLSIYVEAFDLKGYSTGYGKSKNLFFSSSTGIHSISTRSFPNKYSAKYSTGKLNIDIPYGEKDVRMNLILYDMRGRIIKKLNLMQMSPGSYGIRLPIQEIPSGHYYLQVISSRFRSLIPCPIF